MSQELIEADIRSIESAMKCLESMPFVRSDERLGFDFCMVWRDLSALSRDLRRKLDKLKNEGGGA